MREEPNKDMYNHACVNCHHNPHYHKGKNLQCKECMFNPYLEDKFVKTEVEK